jgi:hypothetical protein
MVDDDSISPHEVRKLSQHEIDSLADRLFARSVTILAIDTLKEMRSDTLLAVAVLRVVVRDMPDDGLAVRIWKGEP